jgi:hypothetical protein
VKQCFSACCRPFIFLVFIKLSIFAKYRPIIKIKKTAKKLQVAKIRINLDKRDKRTINAKDKHLVKLQFNTNFKTASNSFYVLVAKNDWDDLNRCVPLITKAEVIHT